MLIFTNMEFTITSFNVVVTYKNSNFTPLYGLCDSLSSTIKSMEINCIGLCGTNLFKCG